MLVLFVCKVLAWLVHCNTGGPMCVCTPHIRSKCPLVSWQSIKLILRKEFSQNSNSHCRRKLQSTGYRHLKACDSYKCLVLFWNGNDDHWQVSNCCSSTRSLSVYYKFLQCDIFCNLYTNIKARLFAFFAGCFPSQFGVIFEAFPDDYFTACWLILLKQCHRFCLVIPVLIKLWNSRTCKNLLSVLDLVG